MRKRKKRSLESRLKMSQIAKEKNYGTHLQSPEVREKNARLNRERMKGNALAIGHKHSEAFKNKMSKLAKAWWQDEEYRKKMVVGNRGEKNPSWKGGKPRIRKDGYVLIYQPNHPHCSPANCVLEHRLVMEKCLGRYLKTHEVVHHKNGIRSDNRIENLELFSGGTKRHSLKTKELYLENQRLKEINLILLMLLANKKAR